MYAYSRWLLGLSFASVGILIYYLFRKDEEPDENFGISSSRRTTIEVKVPEDMIGTIIGRGGCNIRSIQDKTGARIRCNDKLGSDVFRIVTIQGAPDSAQLAEFMIRDMIINQPPIVTTEIWIPTKACGRIIGKGGESIRAMTSMTNAKILIDTKYGEGEQAKTRVVLKGTEEQVDSAKQMIECKVIEEDDFQRRLVTSANQSMRREPNKNINYLLAPSSDEEVKVMSKPGREKLISAGSDGFVDVFVSASETPGQFWVQVISSKGVQLDWLVDEMTEYYSEPKNQQLHVLNESQINLGQIVAAPFENDNKWYRAEILEIKENEYDPQESEVSLYYKDFGDKCVLKQKKIFDLCSKYLFLDFQAIECSLAKIEPVGSQWSSETCHVFDELAGVALWEKRLAYVVTYKDSAQQRGHEESGPLPVIELHDTEKKINIGEELVKRKLARWESNVSGEDKSDTKVTKPIHVSQPEGQVHTSNQKVQNENLGLKHPSKMATSASFGPGSTTSTSKSGGLGSFLENERKGKSSSGFRPKTLGLPSKVQTKPTVVAVPESFSSDEDSDGFVLG